MMMMSLLWLEPLLGFLSLEDIARISACSRTIRDKVKLSNVNIAATEFKQIAHCASSVRFFRRVIDPTQVNSLTIALDPCEPQRAALLGILRSFTQCLTHDESSSPERPNDDEECYVFGYGSSLTQLKIVADLNSSILEGHLQRSHRLFTGFCEDDKTDEKRLYCPCVDWSDRCIHEGTLFERRSVDPKAHANWMCWLLKDDWYNIFRWFPKLTNLSLPLSHRRTTWGTLSGEYVPMIEFMFPTLGVKHGSKKGSCKHPGLRKLILENISDYTLMIDQTSECSSDAMKLEHLSLTCLAETSRRVLGSFVRNIVATELCTPQLIDGNLKYLQIRTAPQAIYYCTGIRTVAEADDLNRSMSASDQSSQHTSSEIVDYGENLHKAKELYRKLALTFSTLLAVRSDKQNRCDEYYASTDCGNTKTRSYAPLIFHKCLTLSIDACSLMAQEDLPHAFPNLRTLGSSIWIPGELDVGAVAAKAHFVQRIVSLLTILRSLTFVTIEQTLDLRLTEELTDHSFDQAQHTIEVEREICQHRYMFLRDGLACVNRYQSIWLVMPVLNRDGLNSITKLVLMPYNKKLLSPFVKFTIIATGKLNFPTTAVS